MRREFKLAAPDRLLVRDAVLASYPGDFNFGFLRIVHRKYYKAYAMKRKS